MVARHISHDYLHILWHMVGTRYMKVRPIWIDINFVGHLVSAQLEGTAISQFTSELEKAHPMNQTGSNFFFRFPPNSLDVPPNFDIWK